MSVVQQQDASRRVVTVDHATWTIYTPLGKEQIGHPLWRIYNDLRRARGLAWRLLIRDLSAQYRQSLLGYIWAFVPPMALVASFLLIGQAQLFNTDTTTIPYPLFALTGVVLWQTFSEAVLGPITTVKEAHRMMAKISLPCEALVLAKLGETVFTLAIRMSMVGLVLCWYGIPISWSIIFVIPVIGVLLAFGTALGLILAPIGGLYDDVKEVMALVLSLWFVLTPVMYEQAASGSVMAAINAANPMTSVITIARELLTSTAVTQGVAFSVVTAVAMTLLVFGSCFYRSSLAYVVERTSG